MRRLLMIGGLGVALALGAAGVGRAEKPAATGGAGSKGSKGKGPAGGKGAPEGKGAEGTVATEGTGEVRGIAGVRGVKLGAKPTSTGEARELQTVETLPVENAPKDGGPAVDEDIARERALKQMRRYEKAIDACVAAARKKGAKGELELSLSVVERKVTPSVVKDTTGSPQLVKCIHGAAKTWELPAAKLTLPYTIVVGAAPAAPPAR